MITFKDSNIMFISRTPVSALWEKEYININCIYIFFHLFLSLYFKDNVCRSLSSWSQVYAIHITCFVGFYQMPFYLTIRENSLTIYEGIIQKKVNKAEV